MVHFSLPYNGSARGLPTNGSNLVGGVCLYEEVTGELAIRIACQGQRHPTRFYLSRVTVTMNSLDDM